MTYPVRPHVARKRTAKQEASAERKERFWAARMARAHTPKERAQVLYDRLRAAPDDSLPVEVTRAMWELVTAGLSDLVEQAERHLERAKGDRREQRSAAGRDQPPATFW